jgi:DNA-binding beta-propeller fold protein YncE
VNMQNTLQTFTPAGVQTTPTITTGLGDPQGLALDDSGKIYVTNYATGTLTTYTSQGKPSNPKIRHLAGPIGIALH